MDEPRESFGELLERLTAVVWEADPATLELTFVSRHAEELLDYPLAYWLEEPGFREQAIHRGDRARVRDELRSLGSGDHVLEYRMVRADGTVISVRDLVHVVADWQGRARGLYGVLVATGVTGERVDASELPAPATGAARRLPALDGLDLDAELLRHESALDALVGDQIELAFGLGLDGARVDIAGAELERLLLDLCLDARDSMLQGGTVTLTTGVAQEAPESGPGRYALLAIRDTGVGIDAVLRARVFASLFSGAPEQATPVATGLHRAREIVAAAGGELVVTSHPGQGSCFEVYLPLAGEPAAARV
jgi:Histidine kinase-, DNA gyrase B-, and HSP90-like ATPase/PAS fold